MVKKSSWIAAVLAVFVSSLWAQNLGRVPIQITRVPTTTHGVFFVKASIPLPEAAGILNTERLAIVDEGGQLLFAAAGGNFPLAKQGQRLAAQFTVLSRWQGTVAESGKPIKWLLAEFPLDPSRNSTDQIVLTTEAEPESPSASLQISETASAIRIATGKLSATISKKRGTLFEQLQCNGRTLLQASPENAFTLQDANGVNYFTGLALPHEIKIEKRGPQVATILVRGAFKNAAGSYLTTINDSTSFSRLHQPFPFLTYTLRYHFYAEQDYLTLDFTLENNGVYGYWTELKFAGKQWLYFQSLALNLNFALADTAKKVTTEGFSRAFNDELWELYQNHVETNLSEAQNFSYRISKNGALLKSGARARGWLEVHDGNNGLVAAVQHFWQNAPKKISWQKNRLQMHLWPAEGKWPSNVATTGFEPDNAQAETYQFEGGRHKTHTLLLRFYEGP
ncbi:hypothetical protein HUU05_28020, partial [candidate division KSB1 bacterium]|nr:hypothetical protein [candidate division KSB1 bacterium]